MHRSMVCILPFLAICLAAPSWADSNDAAFLKAVKDHGLTFASDQVAINIGHLVCKELDGGMSPNAIVAQAELYGNTVSESDSRFVVQTAAAAYCPALIN